MKNGTVYSLVQNKYIGSIDKKGYIRLPGYGLHVIVWMVGNKSNIPLGYDVHHIDGNKLNNSIYNLELIEHKKHMSISNKGKKLSKEHIEKWLIASANKRKGVPLTKEVKEKLSQSHLKKVAQYTKDGELIKIYDGAIKCKEDGYDNKSVNDCCRGKLKTYKGFIWKYYNENVE